MFRLCDSESANGLVSPDAVSDSLAACAQKHGRTWDSAPKDPAGAAQIRELGGQRRVCPGRAVRSQLTKHIWNLRRASRRKKYDAMLDTMTSSGKARQWRQMNSVRPGLTKINMISDRTQWPTLRIISRGFSITLLLSMVCGDIENSWRVMR